MSLRKKCRTKENTKKMRIRASNGWSGGFTDGLLTEEAGDLCPGNQLSSGPRSNSSAYMVYLAAFALKEEECIRASLEFPEELALERAGW